MKYEPATGPCTGHAMAGTSRLYSYVLVNNPPLAGNGVYNCRPVRGGKVLSCHGEGRAMDINAKLPQGGPDPNPISSGSKADVAIRACIAVFVAQHELLGVQRCLYKEIEWTVGKGYTKPSHALQAEHQQHMHIEQTRGKASSLTMTEIEQAFHQEDDDMTPAQEAKIDKLQATLDAYFGINPDGSARDIRRKIDANYIALYGTDHPELPAGQLKALVDGTKP